MVLLRRRQEAETSHQQNIYFNVQKMVLGKRPQLSSGKCVRVHHLIMVVVAVAYVGGYDVIAAVPDDNRRGGGGSSSANKVMVVPLHSRPTAAYGHTSPIRKRSLSEADSIPARESRGILAGRKYMAVLSMGSPAQSVSVELDTGSTTLAVPAAFCGSCAIGAATYDPGLSKTSSPVACDDPQCASTLFIWSQRCHVSDSRGTQELESVDNVDSLDPWSAVTPGVFGGSGDLYFPAIRAYFTEPHAHGTFLSGIYRVDESSVTLGHVRYKSHTISSNISTLISFGSLGGWNNLDSTLNFGMYAWRLTDPTGQNIYLYWHARSTPTTLGYAGPYVETSDARCWSSSKFVDCTVTIHALGKNVADDDALVPCCAAHANECFESEMYGFDSDHGYDGPVYNDVVTLGDLAAATNFIAFDEDIGGSTTQPYSHFVYGPGSESGIFGLGYHGKSETHGYITALDTLLTQNGMANAFSLCLDDSNSDVGQETSSIDMGGALSHKYTGEMKFLPLLSEKTVVCFASDLYCITAPNSLGVDNVETPSSSGWHEWFVDSGNGMLMDLPVDDAVSLFAGIRSWFRTNVPDSDSLGACAPDWYDGQFDMSTRCEDILFACTSSSCAFRQVTLNPAVETSAFGSIDRYPNVTLRWTNLSSSELVLTLPPSSYLSMITSWMRAPTMSEVGQGALAQSSFEKENRLVSLLIDAGPQDNYVLGSGVLQQYYTFFDREHARIGFAERSGACNADVAQPESNEAQCTARSTSGVFGVSNGTCNSCAGPVDDLSLERGYCLWCPETNSCHAYTINSIEFPCADAQGFSTMDTDAAPDTCPVDPIAQQSTTAQPLATDLQATLTMSRRPDHNDDADCVLIAQLAGLWQYNGQRASEEVMVPTWRHSRYSYEMTQFDDTGQWQITDSTSNLVLATSVYQFVADDANCSAWNGDCLKCRRDDAGSHSDANHIRGLSNCEYCPSSGQCSGPITDTCDDSDWIDRGEPCVQSLSARVEPDYTPCDVQMWSIGKGGLGNVDGLPSDLICPIRPSGESASSSNGFTIDFRPKWVGTEPICQSYYATLIDYAQTNPSAGACTAATQNAIVQFLAACKSTPIWTHENGVSQQLGSGVDALNGLIGRGLHILTECLSAPATSSTSTIAVLGLNAACGPGVSSRDGTFTLGPSSATWLSTGQQPVIELSFDASSHRWILARHGDSTEDPDRDIVASSEYDANYQHDASSGPSTGLWQVACRVPTEFQVPLCPGSGYSYMSFVTPTRASEFARWSDAVGNGLYFCGQHCFATDFIDTWVIGPLSTPGRGVVAHATWQVIRANPASSDLTWRRRCDGQWGDIEPITLAPQSAAQLSVVQVLAPVAIFAADPAQPASPPPSPPSQSTVPECAEALQQLCQGAKRASTGNCFLCTSTHTSQLQRVGCIGSDFDRFCEHAILTPDPCPTCINGATFATCMKTVNAVCCDEKSEDCSSGEPATCNAGCAAVLVPANRKCQTGFFSLPGMAMAMAHEKHVLSQAAAKCNSTVSQPCHTLHEYTTLVQDMSKVCCTDSRNCQGGAPTRCDAQCALSLHALVTACKSYMQSAPSNYGTCVWGAVFMPVLADVMYVCITVTHALLEQVLAQC
eukprot:COSAG01_NODE_32_length_35644_cov_22.273738_12_plen_1613_part_00